MEDNPFDSFDIVLSNLTNSLVLALSLKQQHLSGESLSPESVAFREPDCLT